MKNIFRIVLAVMFANFLSIGIVFAGQYTEKGYITMVKANNLKGYCFLELSRVQNGKTLQGGYWNCRSTDGQSMLELTKTARIYGFPVHVTFEGDGSVYKPVYAVEIK